VCLLEPFAVDQRTATMSEEVNPQEFARRIRQLGEQTIGDKKLEEELIQGRSERLARRAGVCTRRISFVVDSTVLMRRPTQSALALSLQRSPQRRGNCKRSPSP
jgi:hypothetical protein